MKKRFYAIIVVILYLIIFVPFPPLPNISVPKVHATDPSPSVVGTSATNLAVAYNYQRKTFYANGRFWVFYSDSINMVYRTSTDGVTWSAATIVRAATSGEQFSIYFDGTYLHYVYDDFTFGGDFGGAIYYRRGTPNADGTITWSATEQVAVPGVSGIYYVYPTIAVDSNGYVWIGYQGYDGTNYYPYVTRSGNNDGTWGTTPSGFPYQLSTTSSGGWFVDVQPLTNGKMFVSYLDLEFSIGDIYALVWTGTSWTSPAYTTYRGSIYSIEGYSMVSEGDNVNIVLSLYNSPVGDFEAHFLRYIYSSNSFSLDYYIGYSSDSIYPVVSQYNNITYIFWMDDVLNEIFYTYYDPGLQYAPPFKSFLNESVQVGPYISVFRQAYGSTTKYIGMAYETNTAAPYNVKFVYFTPPSSFPSSMIGNFAEVPSTVYPNKYFLLNVTVNDYKGASDIINASVGLSQYGYNKIVLLWTRATNTFSKYQDPRGYATLDTAGSFSTQLNTTAYKLTFRLKLSANYPNGLVQLDGRTYSSGGYIDTNLYTTFNFVNLPHAILKSVYFDSSGNPIFNIVSSADNSIITSFSQRKINNNTWLIYNIQNGISNTTVNVYERKYGPYTFRVAADNNATIPFNLISDIEGKIDFNVTGPTTVKVWLGIIGEPYQVLRDNTVWTNWTWDNTNHVLSVNITASRITLVWNINPNPSRGGGGGGGAGGSSGGGTGGGGGINQPTIPIPEIPNGLITLGIVAILIILMLVFAYGKIEENKDINRLFKKRFSKPLPKIDMKKKRKSLW